MNDGYGTGVPVPYTSLISEHRTFEHRTIEVNCQLSFACPAPCHAEGLLRRSSSATKAVLQRRLVAPIHRGEVGSIVN